MHFFRFLQTLWKEVLEDDDSTVQNEIKNVTNKVFMTFILLIRRYHPIRA